MIKSVCVIFLIFIGSLSAQEGAQKTYSLKECLDIATKHNFDIILSEAQVNYSGADITQAFGQYLPYLDVTMGYSRTLNEAGQIGFDVNGNKIDNSNSYSINANASLTIFDGFGREANYSRAQNRLGANKLTLTQTIQNVRINVYLQYIDIVRNTQLIKIRRENFEQGKKELERIQAQYESGFIPVNAVYSQEAELGNREVEIVQAENQLNFSKTTLLATMGLNPDFDAEFVGSEISDNVNKQEIDEFRKRTGTLQIAVNQAMNNRNDYKSAEMNLVASKASVSMANAEYMPQLTAVGGWRWNYYQFGSFSEMGRSFAGLNLAIPVFNNFTTNLQVQNAVLQLTQAEVQMQRVEQSIKQAVQNAVLKLDAAEKQLEISQRAIKAAERNFEVTSERFRQGSANITDYTLANTQYITSQINRITAVYGYIAAQREVEFATGNLR